MAKSWECKACGEKDLSQRTGKAWFCNDCKDAREIYRTTRGNLKNLFNRTNKGACDLEMEIDDFCRWRKSQPLECHYCGITQDEIPMVGMKSQIQLNVRRMGVDRLDSSRGYVVENMAPCCFVCNQVKGDRFDESQMKIIGAAIGAVWRRILGKP